MAAAGGLRMDPSRLRELLNVLRDAGVASAEIPTESTPLRVTFAGHAAATDGERSQSPLVSDEDLPELAFDPIARRRAAKAQT
jgi:hypothetical protein